MNGNILAYLGLAGNEGMDPYSSPYINHYCRFHFLFHSFIPSSLIRSQLGVSGVVRWKGPQVTGKGVGQDKSRIAGQLNGSCQRTQQDSKEDSAKPIWA